MGKSEVKDYLGKRTDESTAQRNWKKEGGGGRESGPVKNIKETRGKQRGTKKRKMIETGARCCVCRARGGIDRQFDPPVEAPQAPDPPERTKGWRSVEHKKEVGEKGVNTHELAVNCRGGKEKGAEERVTVIVTKKKNNGGGGG